MYKVRFYRKKDGESPVEEYIKKLAAQKGKGNRINLGKIRDYIKILEEHGTRAGEPFVKKIDDKDGYIRLTTHNWMAKTYIIVTPPA